MQIFRLDSNINKVKSELIRLADEKSDDYDYSFPFIMFCDMSTEDRLGYFDKEQNSITLSLDLIQPELRETLENVFLHELAHCIQFWQHGQTGHDATFRQICRSLGIPEEYSSAFIKKDLGLEKKTSVKKKVQKLLNLSKSDFEGEASSALEKAKQLMEKYSLSYVEDNDMDGESTLYGVCVFASSHIPTWRKTLGAVVSSLTGCFRLIQKGDLSSYIFYGSSEQVESAVYLWQELEYVVTREAEKLAQPMLFERVNRNEIKYGILTGMMHKINAGQSSSKSIVLASEKNKRIFVDITGNRLRSSGGSVRVGSQFANGVRRGESMDIPSASEKRIKRITDR